MLFAVFNYLYLPSNGEGIGVDGSILFLLKSKMDPVLD